MKPQSTEEDKKNHPNESKPKQAPVIAPIRTQTASPSLHSQEGINQNKIADMSRNQTTYYQGHQSQYVNMNAYSSYPYYYYGYPNGVNVYPHYHSNYVQFPTYMNQPQINQGIPQNQKPQQSQPTHSTMNNQNPQKPENKPNNFLANKKPSKLVEAYQGGQGQQTLSATPQSQIEKIYCYEADFIKKFLIDAKEDLPEDKKYLNRKFELKVIFKKGPNKPSAPNTREKNYNDRSSKTPRENTQNVSFERGSKTENIETPVKMVETSVFERRTISVEEMKLKEKLKKDAENQKKRLEKEVSIEEKKKQSVMESLNKVAPDNLPIVERELLEVALDGKGAMNLIIELLVEKAWTDKKYAKCYATLCKNIDKSLREKSQNYDNYYKKQLCQKLEDIVSEHEHQAIIIKHCKKKNNDDPSFVKNYKLGIIYFITTLLEIRAISSLVFGFIIQIIINNFLKHYFASKQPEFELEVECLAHLFDYVRENKRGADEEFTNEFISQLRDVIKNKDTAEFLKLENMIKNTPENKKYISPERTAFQFFEIIRSFNIIKPNSRIGYLIQNLEERRANGWRDSLALLTSAKKSQDVRKEHEDQLDEIEENARRSNKYPDKKQGKYGSETMYIAGQKDKYTKKNEANVIYVPRQSNETSQVNDKDRQLFERNSKASLDIIESSVPLACQKALISYFEFTAKPGLEHPEGISLEDYLRKLKAEHNIDSKKLLSIYCNNCYKNAYKDQVIKRFEIMDKFFFDELKITEVEPSFFSEFLLGFYKNRDDLSGAEKILLQVLVKLTERKIKFAECLVITKEIEENEDEKESFKDFFLDIKKLSVPGQEQFRKDFETLLLKNGIDI